MFDYFYGEQSEQFSFYRVPKVLFTNPVFQEMSVESKILYGLFLDRMSLSAKNNWVDDTGRVYIIFTIEQIMKAIGCSDKKVGRMLKELEEDAGLIERKRQGLCKPNLIYVKNFLSRGQEIPILNRKNVDSGIEDMQAPESSRVRRSNIELSETNKSDIDHFHSYDRYDEDGMQERKQMEEYFRESISLEHLLLDHPEDKAKIMGIFELLVDTCCSQRKYIRIAGDDKPAPVVKSRFMKLSKSHIEYVLITLSKNTTKVQNMKQYMLATLYNAPTTMEPYYQAWLNNDMAMGRI